MSDMPRNTIHSAEAERSLLGCLFRRNDDLGDAQAFIRGEEDFYIFANRCVYRGILELSQKGQAFDPVTLAHWLNSQKLIEDVGGHAYLAELWDAAPTIDTPRYAKIVQEFALLRGLVVAADETIKDVENRAGPTDELVGRAEQRFFELSTIRQTKKARHAGDLITEAGIRLNHRMKHKTDPGHSFGWDDLDLVIRLRPNEVTIVAARTSVGKTVFGLNLATNLAMANVPTLFASLEMSDQELTDRLACMVSNLDFIRYQYGNLTAEEYMAFCDAAERIKESSLYINDNADQTMLQISGEARRMKSAGQLEVLIVDYLQIVRPEVRRRDKREEIDDISRRLKLVAKQLSVPVIALCQVNRAGADKEPELHMLRDSGAIEQDADNVIILHKDEVNEKSDTDEMSVIVAKQRNGPKKRVFLTHHKSTFRLVGKERYP